jgi:hypothetical protein
VKVSELEHDLSLSHGAIVRIIQELGFHKFVHDGFREHYPKAIRRKEWLVLSHSSNMPFLAMHTSNALSLETRRGFSITPRKQNVQAWSGNIPGPREQKIQDGQIGCQIDGYGSGTTKGLLLVDFMEKVTTINAASYCGTLERLKTAIKRKRPGLLTKGVLILHDNARPHVAIATQELLQHFRWTVLEHPAYSPHLTPSDFHHFPALKVYLAGHKFSSDDVKTAVMRWLKL